MNVEEILKTRPESPASKEGIQWTLNTLIKQGSQSVSRDGRMCLYRGRFNKRCAAGWWIDDPRIKEFEGSSVGTVTAELSLGFSLKEIDSLERMQCCHDHSSENLWIENITNAFRKKFDV